MVITFKQNTIIIKYNYLVFTLFLSTYIFKRYAFKTFYLGTSFYSFI